MKRVWIFSILLVSCSSIILVFAAYHYYYAPPRYRQPYQTGFPDDTLRIAYIGDSWAFMHKNHDCLIENILEDTKYDYCYISVGINDTFKKMSISYYKKSMDCIILFLLTNNIHPIIQEIPDYNISKAYTNQKFNKKILRHLSMVVNGTPLDCKQQFRDALDELITEKGYQDKVSIIRYKTWNNDYANDLIHLYVSNQMHLNKHGYHVLDSIIATEIISLIVFKQ